ncbi:MAG TPA: hypothetical protein VLH83_03025 [Chthoniobacterales bacterium]|nr:hypothetical protein [Chthoniobacterales bacterium]
MIVAIGILFIGISSTALAQEQEHRLMDRLLKPDAGLANPAQNKKFSDKRMATFDKPAHTKSFYSSQTAVAKTYSDERTFTPRQFAARHFRAGDSSAYISSRAQPTKNDTMIATTAATAGTRVAAESGESSSVREYAGNRPFLDKGKSAKSLQAQNKPLTIEQVRELLNKSK